MKLDLDVIDIEDVQTVDISTDERKVMDDLISIISKETVRLQNKEKLSSIEIRDLSRLVRSLATLTKERREGKRKESILEGLNKEFIGELMKNNPEGKKVRLMGW